MMSVILRTYKNYSYVIITAVVLFAIGLPLVRQVDFMQNDDWVYYENVQNLLNGHLSLNLTTASTFYTLSFIGASFSKLFGITNLPLLTYLVSVFNFLLFGVILIKFHNKDKITSTLLSLLLFFNPIHIYLGIGFMIDNYFLFFVLLSYFVFCEYLQKRSIKWFVSLFVLLILSFFIKQTAIALLIAYAIYGFLHKDKKLFIGNFSLLIGLLVFYYFIMPHTPEQNEKHFNFADVININDFSYFITETLIYILSFTASVFIINLWSNYKILRNKTVLYITVGIIAVTCFILFKTLASYSFPALPNTFNSNGYFIGFLNGNKYAFLKNFKLFTWWNYLGIILTALSVLYIPLLRKYFPKFNFPFIFLFIYIGILWIIPGFFDRYLVLLIPFLIILLTENIRITFLKKILIALNIFILAFVSIAFAADYIYWNSYVWNKAENVHEVTSTPREGIYATLAWNRKYNVCYTYEECNKIEPEYWFRFSKPKSNEEYELSDKFDNQNFMSKFFDKPTVYLYRKK